MSSSQKTPFAVSLNNFTDEKISSHQEQLGQVYPCSVLSVDPINAIVTVNFEVDTGDSATLPQITCPIIGSKYIRIPVQVGDTGICISASTKIGNITGLGKGLPSLIPPSNLGALVFVPVGNSNWTATDLNSIVITSPNTTAVATIGNDKIELAYSSNKITIDSTGITIDGNVVMNNNLLVKGSITGQDGFNISGGTGSTMSVTGNIDTTGTITNNGVSIGSTHKHSGVQTGTSNTGTPI